MFLLRGVRRTIPRVSSADALVGAPRAVREAVELERKKRTERIMLWVRGGGTAFALAQALTYYRPYPPGTQRVALAFVALLGLGNVAAWVAQRRVNDVRSARILSIWSLCLDIAVVSGLAFAYAFDPDTAIWAVIYVLPLEGAIRFGLGGAMATMTAASLLYAGREVYGSQQFGTPFLLTSITFRMGIGYLIASVAGVMSRTLVRDRNSLEKANDRYESLLRALGHLGEGFVVAEPDKILYANEAMEEISGYSTEELTSLSSVIELVAPDERDHILERMGKTSDGEIGGDRFETTMIHKSGRRVDLEVGFKPLERLDGLVVVAIVRDITERKHAERRMIESLERERQAVATLRALDLAKSDFLSTVAHELRTPVTTILGFISTLAIHWDRLEDADRKEFIARVSNGASQLNHLISELLDFSRLERGVVEVKMETCNLSEGVTRAIHNLGSGLTRHIIEVDVPEDLRVIADANGLVRVIENLLTNAAKFSLPGSRVHLSSSLHDGEVTTSVTDTGIGIPESEIDRVFERFYRVNRGNTSPSGTGIGLAIVKDYVESQGGRVWVTPNKDKGVTFSFALHAATEASAPGPNSPERAA